MPRSAFARSAGGHFQFIRLALRLRVPLALATVVFATFGLVTGFVGVDVLLRPLVDQSATHPITALCLFGLGASILRTRRYGRSAVWRYLILASVLVISAARLMDVLLSGSTGSLSGGLFGPVAGFQGHFSIEAAVALGAFAAAALLRQGNGRWGSIFLVVGLGFVFNSLLEISFGITFFNGNVGAFTLMGISCAALSMLSVYIHRPVVRAAFLLGDVGSQTRVMAAAVIVIPWGAGFVLDNFRATGGLVALEGAMISLITWSTLVILMSTSARHEGSVAARRRAEREIAMQSRTDVTTGALNRFGMTEVIEGAWVDFKSAGGQFGMILIDLDYFRRLDATFGHDDGEAVLGRVAATLQPQLRTSDALGRWGADEFLVLLKIKKQSDMDIVAARLRRALVDADNPFCAGLVMEPARIDVPFGVSDLLESDEAPTDAITRADTALHLAKTANAMTKDAEKTSVGVTGPLIADEDTVEQLDKAAAA